MKAKDATIEAAQARVQATVDGIVSLPARLRSAAIDKAEETQAAALAKADEVQAALIAKVEDTKAEILATPQKLQVPPLVYRTTRPYWFTLLFLSSGFGCGCGGDRKSVV